MFPAPLSSLLFMRAETSPVHSCNTDSADVSLAQRRRQSDFKIENCHHEYLPLQLRRLSMDGLLVALQPHRALFWLGAGAGLCVKGGSLRQASPESHSSHTCALGAHYRKRVAVVAGRLCWSYPSHEPDAKRSSVRVRNEYASSLFFMLRRVLHLRPTEVADAKDAGLL